MKSGLIKHGGCLDVWSNLTYSICTPDMNECLNQSSTTLSLCLSPSADPVKDHHSGIIHTAIWHWFYTGWPSWCNPALRLMHSQCWDTLTPTGNLLFPIHPMPGSHCRILNIIGSVHFSHCTTVWGSSCCCVHTIWWIGDSGSHIAQCFTWKNCCKKLSGKNGFILAKNCSRQTACNPHFLYTDLQWKINKISLQTAITRV